MGLYQIDTVGGTYEVETTDSSVGLSPLVGFGLKREDIERIQRTGKPELLERQSVGLKETLEEPIIPLGKIAEKILPKAETKPTQFLRGTTIGTSELAGGLTSPMNIGLLYGAAKIPFTVGKKIISGTFGATMASQLLPLWKEFKYAWDREDTEKWSKLGTELIGTGVFSAAGFKHALSKTKVKPPITEKLSERLAPIEKVSQQPVETPKQTKLAPISDLAIKEPAVMPTGLPQIAPVEVKPTKAPFVPIEAKKGQIMAEFEKPIKPEELAPTQNQPYEMTQKEYVQFKKEQPTKTLLQTPITYEATHRDLVKFAIQEGKLVPDKVLEDYPDLASQSRIVRKAKLIEKQKVIDIKPTEITKTIIEGGEKFEQLPIKEGSLKEIKEQFISGLQKISKRVPDEPRAKLNLESKKIVAEAPIKIEIPDDGTFVIEPNKGAVETTIKRFKGKPPSIFSPIIGKVGEAEHFKTGTPTKGFLPTPLTEKELKELSPISKIRIKKLPPEAGVSSLPVEVASRIKDIANKADSVERQVSDPNAKSIVSDIQDVNVRAHRDAAEWLSRENYFKDIKDIESDKLLSDLIEGKHIIASKEKFNKLSELKKNIKESLNEAWEKANAVGVKVRVTDETGTHWRPVGKIENYIPREIYPNIREKLNGGLKQLYARMLELRSQGVRTNVKNAILEAKESGDPYIVRLIKWLEGKDIKTTPSKIVRLIDKLVNRDYIASYGHLERPRLIEKALPPEFYERRASVLLSRYFTSVARRISEIDKFGQTNEKLLSRLRQLEKRNPQEGKIIRDLLKTYQDKTQHPVSSFIATTVSIAKIGLGTATIPNITQSLISTIPKTGVYNFIRGTLNLLFNEQTKKRVERSGLPSADILRSLYGYDDYGILGKVNDKLTKYTGFQGINRINALLAASATERWVEQGLIPSTKSDFRLKKEWAYANLKKLKINPKDIKEEKVSEEKLIDAMYLGATNTQLFSDITKEPLFLSKPEFRWLTVLKRFGYKQSLFALHDIIFDELKYANPLPLLRLMAGGIMGGAFVVWANRKIYDVTSEMLSKEEKEKKPDWYSKWDREDITVMNKSLDLFAQAGTVGALSDITRLDSKGKISLERQLEFQLKPVVVSEAERAARIVDILTKNGEEGIGKAGKEAIKLFPISKFFMKGKEEKRSVFGIPSLNIKKVQTKKIGLPSLK